MFTKTKTQVYKPLNILKPKWLGIGGCCEVVDIEDSNTIIEASSVRCILGQSGDYRFFEDKFEEQIKVESGRFVVNKKQQTGETKVFAVGDAINRTTFDISSIVIGFSACRDIDKMLFG